MAQLLVMLLSKTNPDDVGADAKCHKRGDVVSIRDDDDVRYEDDPGVAERLGTMWTVVRAPGRASDYSDYTKAEAGDARINRVLQCRAFRFDLDAAAAKPGAVIDEHGALVLSAKDCVAVKATKPALRDTGSVKK